MRFWNAVAAACGFAAIFIGIIAIGVLLTGALDVILTASSRMLDRLTLSASADGYRL